MSRKTRKLMWSVPLLAAVAVIGTLAAFGALGLGNVFANELPNNPQNLKVTAASGNTGRTTLVLTWQASASGAPDMYRIDVSKDNEKFTRLTEVSGTTLTHSHVVRPRGMDRMGTAGWERFYRVYAMNSHGYGSVSTAESAFTNPLAVPGEVSQVKGSSNDPEIINLSWTAPDDGGSDIWGYCILALGPGDTVAAGSVVTNSNCLDRFRSEGAGKGDANDDEAGDGEVIRILPATSYAHTKLRAENKWTYKVYAFNRYGHSKTTSAELTIETDEAGDPSEPGNLFALQAANGMVNLYWTAPDDGGQNIASYRVEVSDTNNKWPTGSFTGLATETDKDSNVALTADPSQDGPMFAAIMLPVVTQTDAMAYQIQHELPTAAEVGTYYYQVKTITGTGGSEKMSAFTETKLKVVDDDGDTPNIQFTAPIPAPVVYADGSARPTQATQSDNETAPEDDLRPGVIKLTVNQPTVTVDGNNVPLVGANSYRVDVSDDNGATWTTVHTATKPINKTEYEHKGLKPEEGLNFRLFAKKGTGYGLASGPVQDYAGNTDMPSKVRTLEATKQGAGSIKLSWVAPEDDGGAKVEQYCILVNELDEDDEVVPTEVTRAGIVTVDAEEEGDQTTCSRLGEPANMPINVSGNKVFQVDADTTMATFSGLAQESRWQFQVYALNKASDTDVDDDASPANDNRHGVSATSDKVSATTDAAVVPGAPQRLSAQFALDNNVEGIGEQGVLLLWNPPANPPGAPVQTYKIERSIDGEDYTVRVSSHTADTTHWADPQEPPEGEVWTYRVTAINDVGPGTEMATVIIPLAEHTTHPPASAALMAVSSLSAMPRSTAGTAEVSWTPGNNATMHWIYAIRADEMEGGYTFMLASSNSLHTLTGLDTGVEYIVAISAGRGQLPGGEWSAWTYTMVTPN